ncbi:MAG: di-trans,poly-cis-decaprenylcistransferase [Tissierellia bacterium]|nr:di-trans,poly-cis-decaprenylcistransferase [Tissierellia bacterium]
MIPIHVGFIMDGNGRWAKSRGLPRSAGHRAGTENIRHIIRTSKDLGIKYLSFYAFSTENFKRPVEEVTFLMNLLIEFFNKELPELIEEGARIHILGDLSLFKPPVRFVLEKAIKSTADNDKIHVCLALGYGGRAEIVRAVNQIIAEGIKKVDEESFEDYLYTAGMPQVDFLIRTSGELRISNFLLYQLAYSELYFTPVYWPDFGKESYMEALEDFARRNRRFGGVEDE